MENQHLTYFKIENFKKFDILDVENIGQFNLIVGDNNVGKTSLLEALLVTNEVSSLMSHFIGALGWRDFQFIDLNINLFETFLKNHNNNKIKYLLKSKQKLEEFTLSIIETASLSKADQDKLNLKNIGKAPLLYSLILEEKYSKSREFEFLQQEKNYENSYTPFVKYNMAYGDDLIRFYSDIIQVSKQLKMELVQNLNLLIPNIENIEISSGGTMLPRFIISLKNEDRPQYMNQFGDGSIKLLRYLLELIITKGNRLMIDEIDTGIHYSRMKEFWKIIISSAKKNDVQIFTTTHSKECLQYYQMAVEECNVEKDARIIKLAETKNGVRAYTNVYEQFQNSLIADSEIR